MAKRNVTLKADLGRGVFYWVCQVEAESDEEAVVAAENLFLTETERQQEWEFNEFNVDPA